jgi:fatty acid desaturase
VQSVTINRGNGDFSALASRVRSAGLLDRRVGYYSVKIATTVAAYAAGWAALVIVGDRWAALGIAAFLGLMFTQLGFLGHDAGHLQIFQSHRANRRFGLFVADFLIGLSFGWWVPKHNAHHAHPNQVGRDPDIGEGLVVVRSPRARPAEGAAESDEPRATHQAPLFFVLMLLRSVGLHVSGVQRLVRQRDRAAAIEGVLLGVHSALYLSLIFWVLTPVKAVAFIAVQQAIFSVYLGLSFAPNHKGMPLLDGNVDMTFAERQVMTARNITGGWLTDLLLGGLNYQIEHHLFPTMPRPNLARAQRLVRDFCITSGLGYCETSAVDSYRQVARHANAAAAAPIAAVRGGGITASG